MHEFRVSGHSRVAFWVGKLLQLVELPLIVLYRSGGNGLISAIRGICHESFSFL